MEANTLINLILGLLAVILVLVAYNLNMVFRLKDADPFRNWNATKINGALLLIFMIVGLVAMFYYNGKWDHLYSLVYNPASEHGVAVDTMFWRTMYVSVLVVVVVNVALFYFSWRYQERPGQKALYYPHNNNLEIIWTVVPAIVMTALIGNGVVIWHRIMDPDDAVREKAINVEFYGRQFDWTIRYSGSDQQLGQTHIKYINSNTGNQLGFNFEDPRTHDDIVVTEIHLPVGVPVHMHIRSQDVLHSATLAQFRVKMDAVPGMPTEFWFTPTVTTAQMREKLKNPDFNYEMSCQQICGAAHYNMRRVVVIETMEAYQKWLAEQKPFFATYRELNGMDTQEETPVATEADPAQAEAAQRPVQGISMK